MERVCQPEASIAGITPRSRVDDRPIRRSGDGPRTFRSSPPERIKNRSEFDVRQAFKPVVFDCKVLDVPVSAISSLSFGFVKISSVQGRTTVIAIIAAVVGLIAGFLLANSINRSQLTSLRAENETLKKERQTPVDPSAATLSAEEIRSTIKRADDNPSDYQTQRNVGIAMYRYAATKQDTELFADAIRLLTRAHELRPEDHDVTVALANAYFDVGYFSKDNAAFDRSRQYYEKALVIRPRNTDVIVDVGLSYFLQNPPDYERSVAQFRRGLAVDPKHEKTLQYIVQALIKQNKGTEAATYLQQLRQVNPRNESIAESTSLLDNLQPAG